MLKTIILLKLLIVQIIGANIFQVNKVFAFIPYYSLPSKKFLNKNGKELGKNAYQLLYFGQIKEGLALAKLAVSLNIKDANLWALLAEAQISNKLYNEALISLSKGKSINPSISGLYFAESSIYLSQKKIRKAKISLSKGLSLQPNNTNGLFQLGNIFLIEKKYEKALLEYQKIIKIKSNFWQAFNNKGLIYFELDQGLLSIQNFKKAIAIERNAEPLLALAVALKNSNLEKSIFLAKEALENDPKYLSFEYRREQLWGPKLQKETEKLFEQEKIKRYISAANLYKN